MYSFTNMYGYMYIYIFTVGLKHIENYLTSVPMSEETYIENIESIGNGLACKHDFKYAK